MSRQMARPNAALGAHLRLIIEFTGILLDAVE